MVDIDIAILGDRLVKRFALYYRTVVCLSVLSVTLVYCGQTAGWIKMPLVLEVSLAPAPGHIVLDGDLAPRPQKEGTAPNFRPMFVVAKRPHGLRYATFTTNVGLVPLRIMLQWGPSSRSQKGHSPQFFAHFYCGQTVARLSYC